MQTAINAALGKAVGSLGSTFMAFAVGLLPAGLAILAFGHANLARLGAIHPFYWLGGLFGFVIVMAMIVAVPQVGLAAAITSFVVAQTVAAVIVDHLGLLGVDRMPVTPLRLAGVTLLIVALWLVYR